MPKLLATICLIIVAAVLLNSLHGKDFLVAMPVNIDSPDRHAMRDEHEKLGLDLHSHADKAGKVFTDNPQADTRSLRLRDLKRAIRQNPLLGLFNSWRDRLALHLS